MADNHRSPARPLAFRFSVIALVAVAGFSFLSKASRRSAIYANILDNKSRRMIYEVSLRERPSSARSSRLIPARCPVAEWVQFEN